MIPLQQLEDIDLLECTGTDAAAFLQSLLSNDVRELDQLNAQWSALLSAQGRVLAVIALIRRGPADFVLAVPHRRGGELLEQLQRFRLRRKLSLGLTVAERIVGASDCAPAPPGRALDLRFSSGRKWYLCTANCAALYPASDATWHRADLEDGLPFLKPAACEQHQALALGLDTLPAISFTKGCYPGQEIVARTHYLGRSKRHLVRFETAAADAEFGPNGCILNGAGQSVGEVVDAVHDTAIGSSRWTLLTVLADAGADSALDAVDTLGARHPLDRLSM